MPSKIFAIIPSGGSGKRFGSDIPKQYLDLCGKPVIVRTIEAFALSGKVNEIIVSPAPDRMEYVKSLLSGFDFGIPVTLIAGGIERYNTVMNCLKYAASQNAEIVMIHDAVRPLISSDLIKRSLISVITCGSSVPGLMPKDTVKQTDKNSVVISTPARTDLRLVQTPQCFRLNDIIDAYRAMPKDFRPTDDASVAELFGMKVKIIDGEENNFKITTPGDFAVAEMIISKREK